MWKLLAPLGLLPLLSPWMLVIAGPALALNVVSSDPAMYSGGFQYNADIVPILIAAAIDGVEWAAPVALGWARRDGWRVRLGAGGVRASGRTRRALVGGLMVALLVATALSGGSQGAVRQLWGL